MTIFFSILLGLALILLILALVAVISSTAMLLIITVIKLLLFPFLLLGQIFYYIKMKKWIPFNQYVEATLSPSTSILPLNNIHVLPEIEPPKEEPSNLKE